MATAGTGTYVPGDFIVDAGIIVNSVGVNLQVTNGVIVIGDLYNSADPEDDWNGPGNFNIQSGSFSFDPGTGNLTEMDLGNGPRRP